MSFIPWLLGALPTVQKTTSAELGGINPAWFTGAIIDPRTKRKITGVPWGHYALPPSIRLGLAGEDEQNEILNFGTGELFLFDKRQFLAAELANNLNMVIVGEINMGKSSGIKIWIIRGTKAGYRFLVIDPKGEYALLVNAIPGAREIRFGKDADIYLNACDPILDVETVQIPLISRLSLIAMGEEKRTHSQLEVFEHTLVEAAVMDANEHFGYSDDRIRIDDPTLPIVVERLDNPSTWMREHMKASIEDVSAGGMYYEIRKRLARALSRYTKGDMRGMFHKKTSPGIFKEAPLVVMNCENLEDEHQAAVVVLLQFLVSNKLGAEGSSRQFDEVVTDEGWKLSRDRRWVDTNREGTKLGRSRDIGFTCLLHNLLGAERSSYGYDAIKDLIGDCDFRMIYNQPEDELELSATALRVNDPSLKWLIPKLSPRVALLQAGKRLPPFLVRQHAKAWERPLLETTGINKDV